MLILPKQIKSQLIIGVIDTISGRLHESSENLRETHLSIRANTLKIFWGRHSDAPFGLRSLKLVFKDDHIMLLTRRRHFRGNTPWNRTVIENVRVSNTYGPINADQFNALAEITRKLVIAVESSHL